MGAADRPVAIPVTDELDLMTSPACLMAAFAAGDAEFYEHAFKPFRDQLIREFGDSAMNIMLAELATAAFYESQRRAMEANKAVADRRFDQADKIDRMAARSRENCRRILGTLARAARRPVKMIVAGDIGNLNMGAQTITNPEPAT